MTETPGIVVVGGGPAGLQTARSYRESGGTAPVTVLCREPRPPYNRPPLTKEFLRGEMQADELPLVDPGWYTDNDVALELGSEAVSLDTDARTITLAGGEKVPYSGCVIATGSDPALLPVPGVEHPDVRVIRTLEDSERLISEAGRVGEPGDGRFVVIGSGFIGCEAAASLAMRGLDVVVLTLENAPQETRLGPEVAREIRSWLLDLGVELQTGAEVNELSREGDGFTVALGNGETVRGDALLVGAGVQPNTRLATDAGIRVDGGIVCDASTRTSAPDVFAVGDVALTMNEAAGRPLRVEHWGDALGQGRACGETLAGRESRWRDVPGFWSTIGENTLKYAAWGDGWDEARFTGDGEAFTVWYGLEGSCVGVLTHGRDEDYERGRGLVEKGAGMPV